MKKTVKTSVQEVYEPPYAEIIEFAVEGGFSLSSEVDPYGYSINDGTEMPERYDVPGSWYNIY